MDTLLFLSFLAATFLIVVTPGPSVALASSQAVRFGPKAAAVTVAGDALGSVVHILIAVASLQTFIGISEFVLPYLQIGGGLFILYLAWQSFRSADTIEPMLQGTQTVPRVTFFAGFFACVTNPKAIVFLLRYFPVSYRQIIASSYNRLSMAQYSWAWMPHLFSATRWLLCMLSVEPCQASLALRR